MELCVVLQSAVALFSFGATALLAELGCLPVDRCEMEPSVSEMKLGRGVVAVYRTQQEGGR